MAGEWAIVAAALGGTAIGGFAQAFIARQAAKASEGRWLLQETKTAYSALLDKIADASSALTSSDVVNIGGHIDRVRRATFELSVLGQPEVLDRFGAFTDRSTTKEPHEEAVAVLDKALTLLGTEVMALASNRFRDVPGYTALIPNRMINWPNVDARYRDPITWADQTPEASAEYGTKAQDKDDEEQGKDREGA